MRSRLLCPREIVYKYKYASTSDDDGQEEKPTFRMCLMDDEAEIGVSRGRHTAEVRVDGVKFALWVREVE